jgi:DNA recombination protein RmuC
VEQPTGEGEDGRLRPDVIVKLAGGTQIVIDAKVPLTAYLEAVEATDDGERDAHLARHAGLVRAHMTALSRKTYWDTFSPSPDYVIMFLPVDALHTVAYQHDPSLIDSGANEKVLLATPTMLIALLKLLALGWREHTLALNAQEVADLGRQLYQRVGLLAEHWSDVGDKLDKAVGSYNKSVGTLEGRLLVTARKFVDLKAATIDDDGELAAPAPIETLPRSLAAPELMRPELAGVRERPARVS